MTLILNGTDNSATVPAVQGGTAGTSTGLYYPTTSAVGISTAGTNAVYIDASQNVGIGGLAAGYTSRLAVVGTGTSTAFRGNINLAVASNGSGYDSTLRFTDSVANSADISMKGGVLATSVNGVFATYIDSSGNVGIGTSSPGFKLEVQGVNDLTFTNDIFTASLTGTDAYNSGNSGGGVQFRGKYTSGGNFTTFGGIWCKKENTTDSTYGAYLAFGTRTNGTAGSDMERMRITSSGNVLVGLTAAGLGGLFEVNGAVAGYSTLRFPYIGSSTGTAVIIDATGYLRALTSSRRYKENIEPIDVGLDLVMQMQPVKYNLKEGGIAQVGFIAEDFPESRLVNYSMIDPTDAEKGEQVESVNYTNLTAILTKAIQEQQALITTLTARIEALEAK